MKYILLLLVIVACGFISKKDEPLKQTELEYLESKKITLLSELHELSDADGWFARDDCDALLWHGLASAAGHEVNLELAEYSSGEWHRRPKPPCWDGQDLGSKSTISQDMFLGLLYSAWRNNNLAGLERLAAYGDSHKVVGDIAWRMGEPYPEQASRVVLRSNLIGVLGRIMYSLSDKKVAKYYRKWPMVSTPAVEDYQEHLQVLQIQLNAEIRGNITVIDFLKAGDLAKKYPDDRLIQTVFCINHLYKGDCNDAFNLIIDDTASDPSYVRGGADKAYSLTHKLFATELLLRYKRR